MNRERAKELLPIIEAFANGEEIQFRPLDWGDGREPEWSDLPEDSMLRITFPADDYEYRIKPKAREFWIVSNENRSDRYPHVLSPEEKEKHFADSSRYIKVREVIE